MKRLTGITTLDSVKESGRVGSKRIDTTKGTTMKDDLKKRKKRELKVITQKDLDYVKESEDQGGEALVLLKDVLFGESSTKKWMETFKKIQIVLDKIEVTERLKLMEYTTAPDFYQYFMRTDEANNWTVGLKKDEINRFISLLATEFRYLYRGDPKKTLKEFNRFRDKKDSDIYKFFKIYHEPNTKNQNGNVVEEMDKEKNSEQKKNSKTS